MKKGLYTTRLWPYYKDWKLNVENRDYLIDLRPLRRLQMIHQLLAEFMGTALMIIFGVGVHADEVLNRTKFHGSGHIFAITTWGFGISIVLFVFGDVFINPAMAMAQLVLGKIDLIYFLTVSVVEVLGGIVGSLIVYVMYADQFKLSEKDIDPVIVRNIFSTAPAIRNLPRNFFVEAFATFYIFNEYYGYLSSSWKRTWYGAVISWFLSMGRGYGYGWYDWICNEFSTRHGATVSLYNFTLEKSCNV